MVIKGDLNEEPSADSATSYSSIQKARKDLSRSTHSQENAAGQESGN